ncbi:Sua5 family C-terminal domain-containing protein, partial [Anaeroglobus sp. AF13-6AC]
ELYRGLLFFDEHPVDLIVAEGVETGGIGTAVMNRMKKAADGDVMTV